MNTDTGCRPTCPCKAANSRDAVERAAKMIGLKEQSALSLAAILRANGWELVKR